MKLLNTQSLCIDCQQNNRKAASYAVKINGHGFSCVLTTISAPYSLFVTTLGASPLTIEFSIDDNFEVVPYIENRAIYQCLIKYLELHFDPQNKFTPQGFLQNLDDQTVPRWQGSPSLAHLAWLLGRTKNYDEATKIYFCGWRNNSCRENVSEENYQKTLLLVTKDVAQMLRQSNISSCWTDNPQKENLSELNKYVTQKR